MQGKKIVIIVLTVFLIALFFLLSIPMRRTYHAKIVVNSDELITYRTLQDTVNWNKWYSDKEISRPQPASLTMQPAKKSKVFAYHLKDQSGYEKKGQIQVSRKNRWNMQINWSEELVFKTNIAKKLHLLFNPSEFRTVFLKNMVQFKNAIEHPDNTFGGLTFERKEMPAGKLVTLSDTVALSEVKEQIALLHDTITAHLPVEDIKNPGTFLSQYEPLNDSIIILCVAVAVTDALQEVKEPFEMIEMDEHPAVIIQTQKSYTDMSEDITIMYEWLKKNDKRPATSYWIRHTPSADIAKATDKNYFTIIQEVYSVK
ncbi:hypothetical protein [Agriterribacter sp.]|uniref:hypothetical protein n=1 Tax=Agriterribacter sp. TaxID=2821509 RepID=UPI002C872880|nr:hypothetical protein [Agriterribacter sp.]HRP55359.1 hypothetical protein [Agriterribacter sp.]